jgi:ABC-type amino acid transport substrate-binding protein
MFDRTTRGKSDMTDSPSQQQPKDEPGQEVVSGVTTVPTSSAENVPGAPATIPALAASDESTERRAALIRGYEILEELGRGSMGVVYKAHQICLKRTVALKMILTGAHASEQQLARFRREGEAVARLQHPNIVQIYEVGEQDGCPYFSLEFVDGGSLAQRLEDTPQPILWSAQLVETLARAAHAAHEHGVIHRDLKPGNILLTSAGVAKITDFGLAKLLEDDADQTKTGTIQGTPSYMAPEQAGGPAKALGPPADVYALGAILYELLTGRPPFRAETVLETLRQLRERDPDPPRAFNADVPRDLQTICLKALAKEPRQRYPSARALAEDLARFVNGQPIQARPVSRLERCWRWCRRNPGMTSLATAAVALLVAVAVLLAGKIKPPGNTPPDDSLRRVQAAGKVVIATDPTYPPMEFRQDGRFRGFGIDLARHLADNLGVQAEFVPVDWNWPKLVRRLNAHQFDLLISTITVTEDRKHDVDFVEYCRLSLVMVGKQGMAVRNEKDLAGKVVAVQRDTTAYELAFDLEQKGIAIKQISALPGASDPFEKVQQGQADVTFAHEPVARYFANKDGRLAIMGPGAHAPDPVGIAFCKQDKQLQNAVAQVIDKMKEDGTLAAIAKRWYGQ